MDRNYWQEYWDNYYKFMAVYLGEVQNAYPNADMKKEYIEVSRLFEPAMPPNNGMNNNNMNNNGMNNSNNMNGNNNLNSNSNMNNAGMNNNNNMNSNNNLNSNSNMNNTGMNNNNMNNYQNQNNNQPSTSPTTGTSTGTPMQPGNQMTNNNPLQQDDGTLDDNLIKPSCGGFDFNTCKSMVLVKITMMDTYNPSNFYMLVDRRDENGIGGYRIAYQSNEIRFIPGTVEFRYINTIECAFK